MSKSEKFTTRSLRKLNRKETGDSSSSAFQHRSLDGDVVTGETSGLIPSQSHLPSPPSGTAAALTGDEDDLVRGPGPPSGPGKLEASAAIVLDAPLLLSTHKNKKTDSASAKNSWKVKYQDFLPPKHGFSSAGHHSSSDAFQKLVDRANEWLKKSSDLQVRTCETVTWMSHSNKTLGDSEQMVLTKRIAENASTYCARGLRLWLVPRIANKPQSICFCDFVPNNDNDNIQSLVANINERIDRNELKGQIMTVETIDVPILNGTMASGTTNWTESSNDDTPYAFVLRVFYNKDVNGRLYGSDRAIVGLKDMVPLPTDDTYEGFEDLIERTNCWLKDQRDILITNLQSVMVQKTDGPHSETGSACYYSQPGMNRPLPVDFFRILRIAYLKPIGALLVDLPIVYPLAFETFTPELVKTKELGISHKERLEKMKETFSKVIAFLQNSGADVLCVETVANPMQIYPQQNLHILPPADEIKFLLTIRLYLTGKFSRVVDGSGRSIKRASVSSGTKQGPEDNEHPGPIFLRHVVNRRFKYRWLILAITAITCMTTIVIVSVIYSNL